MTHLRTTTRTALAAVALAIGLGACSSGGSTTTTATDATSEATSATTAATTAGVDANTATVAELTAAFQAAGIPSASRWAREVEEYRPYPTDDPSFAKLRQELSKYNPSNEVLQGILAALSL